MWPARNNAAAPPAKQHGLEQFSMLKHFRMWRILANMRCIIASYTL